MKKSSNFLLPRIADQFNTGVAHLKKNSFPVCPHPILVEFRLLP
jgi:hypothetical protein